MKTFIEKFAPQLRFEGEIVEVDKHYFLLGAGMEKVEEEVRTSSQLKPCYSGIYLGRSKKEKFYPSSWLLQQAAKLSDKKAVVNSKAEWMLICGKDVWGENIVSSTIDSGDVLILNKHNECIGYGVIEHRGKRKYIRRLFDIGDLLRREHLRKL